MKMWYLPVSQCSLKSLTNRKCSARKSIHAEDAGARAGLQYTRPPLSRPSSVEGAQHTLIALIKPGVVRCGK
jgi:hypothetical protein